VIKVHSSSGQAVQEEHWTAWHWRPRHYDPSKCW